MCSIRRVLCQNSAPYHYFEKNENKILCVLLEECCVKISAVYYYFEKITLKFQKNQFLVLIKLEIQKSDSEETFFSHSERF